MIDRSAARTTRAPRARRTLHLGPLIVLVVALALAGCSGDDGTEATDTTSSDATETTAAEPTGAAADTEFCRRAAQLEQSEEGVDPLEDPEGALAQVTSAAEVAPEELRDDFEVFLDTFEQLSAEPTEDDPSALAGLFEVFMAPEFLDAQANITDYVEQECGFDVGSVADGADDVEGGADGEVSLEEVEAVEDANESESWADKVSSTVIDGGADVQLGSGPEPFTQDEALRLCTAMLDALSSDHPDVEITVTNGTETVAASDGGACSAD